MLFDGSAFKDLDERERIEKDASPTNLSRCPLAAPAK
jgi:hypothetical protein